MSMNSLARKFFEWEGVLLGRLGMGKIKRLCECALMKIFLFGHASPRDY